MKRRLLCTSAIALGVVAAAPATAQEWSLDWGGFMSQHIAIIDGDLKTAGGTVPGFDWSGLEIHSVAEIVFTPSITLDNGMTFGINIAFEGENTGGGALGIDESYMTISSDTFGSLVIGAENSAGYNLMVGAPEVTSMYINSPSISTFIALSASGSLPFAFRQAAISSYTEVAGNDDVRRITYYTPSFNGLTLGVSYARDGVTNAGNNYGFGLDTNGIALSDVWDIGVNYSQSFGTTDVAIGARYGAGKYAVGNPNSDPETWGIGATVTFSGFSVGGSWAENDNGGALGVGDEEGWSFGVGYATGPWSFAATTYQGETNLGGGVKSKYEAYKIGASRELGPGVSWDVYGIMAENGVSGVLKVEGYALGTAINLSF